MSGKLTPLSAVPRPVSRFANLLDRALKGLGVRRHPPAAPVGASGTDVERRLSFMLESVPVNLWSTDAQLTVTFSQGAGLHLIGRSANDQVGLTLYEILKTRDPSVGRASCRERVQLWVVEGVV